jgi:dihydrolipoamide dehydrogenase
LRLRRPRLKPRQRWRLRRWTRGADITCQLVVLGGGPGGYTAAFRAADLGLDVVLVERYAALGGVCLNVGCIPSKALLHAADVIEQAKHAASYGVEFGAPRIDIDKLRGFKDKVVGTMSGGLAGMAKARKVRVVTGTGTFVSANAMEIVTAEAASASPSGSASSPPARSR